MQTQTIPTQPNQQALKPMCKMTGFFMESRLITKNEQNPGEEQDSSFSRLYMKNSVGKGSFCCARF